MNPLVVITVVTGLVFIGLQFFWVKPVTLVISDLEHNSWGAVVLGFGIFGAGIGALGGMIGFWENGKLSASAILRMLKYGLLMEVVGSVIGLLVIPAFITWSVWVVASMLVGVLLVVPVIFILKGLYHLVRRDGFILSYFITLSVTLLAAWRMNGMLDGVMLWTSALLVGVMAGSVNVLVYKAMRYMIVKHRWFRVMVMTYRSPFNRDEDFMDVIAEFVVGILFFKIAKNKLSR